MTGWIVFIVLWTAWLLFMILFPTRWGSIVEKTNRFWTEKGILSKESAAKAIAFEKGLGLKILVLIVLLGGIAIVILDAILIGMTSG